MDVSMVLAILALLAAGYAIKLAKEPKTSPHKYAAATYTKEEINQQLEGIAADIEHVRTRAYELQERVRLLEEK
jgi:Tfp pilus assembly protein PilO